MEEIAIRKQSNKPVYRTKRKKKIYCKGNNEHKEQQKDKHEDVKKRTPK